MGKTGKRNEEKRDYKFSIKLYPDSTEYNCWLCVEKLKGFFEQWAYITHDMDKRVHEKRFLRRRPIESLGRGVLHDNTRRFTPYLKPHVHFYGKNNVHCRITVSQIVRFLEIPYHYAERPNEFSPSTDWLACLFYTVHRNAPEKYQYPVEKVSTNIPNFRKKILESPTMADDLKTLYEILNQFAESGEELPYYELVRIMTVRGCNLQFTRPSMVEKISYSFQYYKTGRCVQ